MLSHDELVFIIKKNNQGAVHGVNFFVAMPIDVVTGEQTKQAFIAQWNLSTPQPTQKEIDEYEVTCEAEISSLRKPSLEQIRAAMPALSPRQFWLAASRIDITKTDVLALVDAMEDKEAAGDLRIEVTESVSFQRTNPAVDQLATLLDITPAQLDALWVWAAEF